MVCAVPLSLRPVRLRTLAVIQPVWMETEDLDVGIDIDARNLRRAKVIYAIRRRRDVLAGIGGLFGEPGWDILLDVYVAQKSRLAMQVSSVCLEAGVPSTTILRWLSRLEGEGLIYRTSDNVDARRRFVRLTEAGEAMMTRILSEMTLID